MLDCSFHRMPEMFTILFPRGRIMIGTSITLLLTGQAKSRKLFLYSGYQTFFFSRKWAEWANVLIRDDHDNLPAHARLSSAAMDHPARVVFSLLCLTQFVTNVGVAIFSNYSSNGSSQQVIIGRKMSQPAIDEESINSQQSIIFQT